MLTKHMDFYPAAHLRETILKFKKNTPNHALWASFILFSFPY